MRPSLSAMCLLAIVALGLAACQPARPAPSATDAGASAKPAGAPAAQPGGPTRVIVGVTETIQSPNPYADSVGLIYSTWCEVYGCLMTWDFQKGDYVGWLAESWKVESPTSWLFALRQGVKWHDGSPFTAADVVHSVQRIRDDPASRQRFLLSPVEAVEAVDDSTVRFVTKGPLSWLLVNLADTLIITSKAAYDQHGDNVWKEKPVGTGPYMLKELVPDQRITLAKNPNWWGGRVAGPDEVVYRVMREPEVRVTALLNGEIQIAQFLPPHMADRVANSANAKLVTMDSVELMFLAMSPKVPPWDNKLLRQAVAHAIDRDAIIQSVLQGQAVRLDGPIGPGQYGYTPDLQPRYPYDPERARQLVREAGFPNGVDVEFSTPVGRYILDKPIAEAIAPMLTAVGIRTKLQTPEWATLWANVQDGKVPFYYMGRGSVIDPSQALSQYFETGVSPRIGYSNPAADALFARDRAAFEPTERKRVLTDLMSLITDEAPAHFLWRHKMLMGVARHVEYTPLTDHRIYANEMRVR